MWKRFTGLIWTIFLVAPLVCAAEEPSESTAWRQFDIDGKTISVNPDADGDGKRSYEVLAEQGGLTVARLSVNRDGILSNAWKTDLDKDGAPEVVVAVGQLNGTNNGGVDIHEWDGYKFVSTKGQARIDAERGSYDGHDQYKLADGQLIREFPRFKTEGDARVPTGDTASYRYDMSSGGWTPN